MSHFTNWNHSQLSKSLMPYDNMRAPRERKRENKKQEDLPSGQTLPLGQMLQKGEDAQVAEDTTKKLGDDKAAEEGLNPSKAEPQKDGKLPLSLGLVCPPLFSNTSASKTVGRSLQLSPPLTKSFRLHDVRVVSLPRQGPFRQFMDMKAEKRLAGRKERRSRFGDAEVHKRYQFGEIFTPFQALATTEMRRLVPPRDLPMSSHLQRMGIPCSTEGDLQDLSLLSTELSLAKEDSNHEKGRPAGHVKTPLFPPIVKATKSNDTK
ncbi:uncharacterized protein LOC103115231 [Erinaceus europaeus]|uniref:Uncharacterized protein LOC103115231 n=1 Tax=Erinaceus europaeus TaxID=9365 RepID=A0ABM3YBE2_ERIEU|nr:uncharacterized protein LOC103115231 [Erinaceus europaeus]